MFHLEPKSILSYLKFLIYWIRKQICRQLIALSCDGRERCKLNVTYVRLMMCWGKVCYARYAMIKVISITWSQPTTGKWFSTLRSVIAREISQRSTWSQRRPGTSITFACQCQTKSTFYQSVIGVGIKQCTPKAASQTLLYNTKKVCLWYEKKRVW